MLLAQLASGLTPLLRFVDAATALANRGFLVRAFERAVPLPVVGLE